MNKKSEDSSNLFRWINMILYNRKIGIISPNNIITGIANPNDLKNL